MLVLFVCLGVAVVVQTLTVAVICGARALDDERAGRSRMEEKDQGLATLREHALTAWGPATWTVVSEEGHPVEGCLAQAAEGAEWVLAATVRQKPEVSRLITAALLERGRDGIDLPPAAVVAGSMSVAKGRHADWLEAPDGVEAVAYLFEPPADLVLGGRCSLVGLTGRWRLDPGWTLLFGEEACSGVAAGPGVFSLTGRRGESVRFRAEGSDGAVDRPGRSEDDPALVVVTGGADLDARGLGGFYGVFVVDEASVRLDGTFLHGAVFATERVDLGETGRVIYDQAILRWATDRSLVRTRLVPGSRWEGTE